MRTMSTSKRPMWLILAIGGILIGWAGGYMLSSSNTKCTDGPTIHECSGAFASDAWHAVGLVFVVVGIAVVITGSAIAVLARRSSHTLGPL